MTNSRFIAGLKAFFYDIFQGTTLESQVSKPLFETTLLSSKSLIFLISEVSIPPNFYFRRWCLLNVGFAKTSLDDIAKGASISRTLVYNTFKNKEEIFKAVFRHWLMAHLPEAEVTAFRAGDNDERLYDVCRVVAVAPWSEMYGAPMSGEFFDASSVQQT